MAKKKRQQKKKPTFTGCITVLLLLFFGYALLSSSLRQVAAPFQQRPTLVPRTVTYSRPTSAPSATPSSPSVLGLDLPTAIAEQPSVTGLAAYTATITPGSNLVGSFRTNTPAPPIEEVTPAPTEDPAVTLIMQHSGIVSDLQIADVNFGSSELFILATISSAGNTLSTARVLDAAIRERLDSLPRYVRMRFISGDLVREYVWDAANFRWQAANIVNDRFIPLTPTPLPPSTVRSQTAPIIRPTSTQASGSIVSGQSIPPTTLYISAGANVRSCPQLDCEIVSRLAAGDEVRVTEIVEGAVVSRSGRWYRSGDRYIHSSLLSNTPPVAAPAAVAPVPGAGGQTSQPAAPALTYACNGIDDLNCEDFRSRQEAQAHLNACGNEDRLDGNNDGEACESLP